MVTVVVRHLDAAGKPLSGSITWEPATSWADGLAVVAAASVVGPVNGDNLVAASAVK